MRQADLPRSRPCPATDQPGVAGRMVRRPERPLADQRRLRRQQPSRAIDARYLQRLVKVHRRQDRWHRPRQQGLAGARRPRHHEVMGAGGGHLHPPLHMLLPADVGEVRQRTVVLEREGVGIAIQPLDRNIPGEVVHEIRQRPYRIHFDPSDQCRLPRIHLRHERTPEPLVRGQRHHGDDPGRMPQDPVERQLTDEDRILDIGHDLVGRDQDAHRNRQVVRRPGLLDVRRRQVHGDLPVRHLTAGVADRRPHPFPALLYRGIRQANEYHARVPAPNVDFDFNEDAIETHNSATVDLCQHRTPPYARQ